MAEPTPMLSIPTVLGTLLQGPLKDSVWASLVLYLMLSVYPAREAWYWNQLEIQRKDYFAAKENYENRRDLQVKMIETECHGHVTQNLELTKINARMIAEIHAMMMLKNGGTPP